MGIKESGVRGYTNIALIKYWGKRNKSLFLPMNGSISMTLDAFYTETYVAFDSQREEDAMELNGQILEGRELDKVSRFLSLVRRETGIQEKAYVRSTNHVPIASGYASSASAYAALAGAALSAALDTSIQELDRQWVSQIARQGSGSACRSVYGGFVEWQVGNREDGLDSYAVPLLEKDKWPLAVVSVSVNRDKKNISSREGMERTVETSPFYEGWLSTVQDDLYRVREAIMRRDFTELGEVLEHNGMKMHATMLGANPPIIYWKGKTLEVIECVQKMRGAGVEAYATTDAGPNVKIICQESDVPRVIDALKVYDKRLDCITCHQGDGLVQL